MDKLKVNTKDKKDKKDKKDENEIQKNKTSKEKENKRYSITKARSLERDKKNKYFI
jgi:hypothetical protein